MAYLYSYAGREDDIPACDLSPEYSGFSRTFYDIRSCIGDPEKPMQPRHIFDHAAHLGHPIEKWEREVFLAMDRSFRSAMGRVHKFHMTRKPLKV